MCGIAGVVGISGDEASARLNVMLRTIAHRGPDGRGEVRCDNGAFGMVRLALLDLSPRGQQPMFTADGQLAILFNGEMYNWREERERLEARGHVFQTTTDTEVVLRLFEDEDVEAFSRIRGMFALALMDWRQVPHDKSHTRPAIPRLLLARGALGIKPLYVAERPNGGLAFASEAKAIIRAGLALPDVDPVGLSDVISFGRIIQPNTFFRGIHMLDPGCYLERNASGQVSQRRFRTIPHAEPRQETLAQAAERLRHVLEESVRLHALADAPVGAFLSGGVDSAAIVGLMKSVLPHLRTYSLVFPEYAHVSETSDTRALAQFFGTEHTEVPVHDADASAAFQSFLACLDMPSTDGFNSWLVAKAAAKEVKAVLSGVGGDELFAGYPSARRMLALMQGARGPLLRTLGRQARVASRLIERRAPGMMSRFAARESPLSMWTRAHTVTPDQIAQRLLGRSVDAVARITSAAPQAGIDVERETVLGLACMLDTRFFMGAQLLLDADATSMAHHLELRVPFADWQMMLFSRSCQDAFKLDANGSGPIGTVDLSYEKTGAKRVLLEAVKDILPPGFSSRPKRGFSLPFAEWVRGAMAPLVDDWLSPEAVKRRGWLDAREVQRLVTRMRTSEPHLAYPTLWGLLSLEGWARAYLDRQVAPMSQERAA